MRFGETSTHLITQGGIMSARTVIVVTVLSASFMMHAVISNAQNCIGECKWDPCHWQQRLNGTCTKPLYDDPGTYFEEEAQSRFDYMRANGGSCSARRNGIYGRPSSYKLFYTPPAPLCVTPTSHPFFGPTAAIEFFYADGSRCALGYMSIDPVCDLSPLSTKLLLSPLEGDPESDQILTSIEPSKTTNTLLAKVINKKTQEIIPNVDIKLELDVKKDSGGHIHAVHNPIVTTNTKGKLQSPNSQTTPDASMFGTLEGNTGDQGLQFTYEAPKPAGDIVITGSCTSQYCKQEGPNTLWVGIKGLRKAQPSTSPLYPYDVLPCGSEKHTECTYLTGKANSLLARLARKFPGASPGIRLRIGDASLERGGLFDIGGDWAIPADDHYAEHNEGKAVDIYVSPILHLDPTDIDYMMPFIAIATNLGMWVQPRRLKPAELEDQTFQPVYFHVFIWRVN